MNTLLIILVIILIILIIVFIVYVSKQRNPKRALTRQSLIPVSLYLPPPIGTSEQKPNQLQSLANVPLNMLDIIMKLFAGDIEGGGPNDPLDLSNLFAVPAPNLISPRPPFYDSPTTRGTINNLNVNFTTPTQASCNAIIFRIQGLADAYNNSDRTASIQSINYDPSSQLLIVNSSITISTTEPINVWAQVNCLGCNQTSGDPITGIKYNPIVINGFNGTIQISASYPLNSKVPTSLSITNAQVNIGNLDIYCNPNSGSISGAIISLFTSQIEAAVNSALSNLLTGSFVGSILSSVNKYLSMINTFLASTVEMWDLASVNTELTKIKTYLSNNITQISDLTKISAHALNLLINDIVTIETIESIIGYFVFIDPIYYLSNFASITGNASMFNITYPIAGPVYPVSQGDLDIWDQESTQNQPNIKWEYNNYLKLSSDPLTAYNQVRNVTNLSCNSDLVGIDRLGYVSYEGTDKYGGQGTNSLQFHNDLSNLTNYCQPAYCPNPSSYLLYQSKYSGKWIPASECKDDCDLKNPINTWTYYTNNNLAQGNTFCRNYFKTPDQRCKFAGHPNNASGTIYPDYNCGSTSGSCYAYNPAYPNLSFCFDQYPMNDTNLYTFTDNKKYNKGEVMDAAHCLHLQQSPGAYQGNINNITTYVTYDTISQDDGSTSKGYAYYPNVSCGENNPFSPLFQMTAGESIVMATELFPNTLLGNYDPNYLKYGP